MKICPQCNGEKPLDAFAVDRSKKDGRKSRCKACDAAAKKKGYYAASPKARSNRVVQQRHRRWRDIARAHGERWVIEQVQTLKQTGRLTGNASHRADDDERLAAFFREAHSTSSETLRTHLGSRLWDRVARPFVPKKEQEAATKERRELLQARLFATDIVGREWNDDEGCYEGIVEGPTTDHPWLVSWRGKPATGYCARVGSRPRDQRRTDQLPIWGEILVAENGSQ